jgi:hypothetical protein
MPPMMQLREVEIEVHHNHNLFTMQLLIRRLTRLEPEDCDG